MTSTTGRDYYTVAEAAKLLNVSHSTVWRWIRAGKLPAYRVGSRSLRIRQEDLYQIGDRAKSHEGLSIEEARSLLHHRPTHDEIDRQKQLFEEVQRMRPNRSIAPLTSDELVRLGRENEVWHGPEE